MGIIGKGRSCPVWSGMQLSPTPHRNQSRVEEQDRIHIDEFGEVEAEHSVSLTEESCPG